MLLSVPIADENLNGPYLLGLFHGLNTTPSLDAVSPDEPLGNYIIKFPYRREDRQLADMMSKVAPD